MSSPSFGGDADATVKRAEKIARGGMFSFLSGGPNLDEAAQLYITAANKYKMLKQWQAAAGCFIHAAYLQEKLSDINQQAKCFVDAADIMKKYSTADAVEYYGKAVAIYNVQGRFSQSGKLLKSIAEMFEEEGNMILSSDYFKKAADLFEMDEYGKSQFSQCILKYADFVSRHQDKYEEAIKVYESEGKKALRNNLIQFGAKEHFLKAGILLLVSGDIVDAKVNAEKYEELDPRLATSREGKLLRELVEAYDSANAEKFVHSIQEYDNVTRLDPWKVHFLYKIKESIAPTGPPLAADGVEGGGGIDLS
eukprot:GHVS01009365.1.p1 GENE.GHVS01009365.1~~GHVS01009365.1.p1  ORF type:complete len:340 (-),score=76.64 GHVS01009365.1:20-943(-)